ncbi:TPA: hypothetical protein HA280_06120 [Candidatus Woesearchaeota archaeon]|nr:hypothetical protein [Candidatus Woesearchaeota archaeon]
MPEGDAPARKRTSGIHCVDCGERRCESKGNERAGAARALSRSEAE